MSQIICRVEQKLSAHQGGCYNITEAQAIMTELRNIQKSLSSGEKEKAELMQSLAKLKDDLTRLQLCESSPDVSTLSLPQEKLSTASQTDLSGEVSLYLQIHIFSLKSPVFHYQIQLGIFCFSLFQSAHG